jgi:hypothetical protein
MIWRGREMPREGSGEYLLFFIVFFFLLVLFFGRVSILSALFAAFFVFFLFIQVVGDEIEVEGMRLRNLELGLTLGTAENLALFDLVFIDIDFGGTFRAADHGSILRWDLHAVGARYSATATVRRIIYRVR